MRIKSNLDEILYGKIYDSIIVGEYKVGDKILIGDLAEKYEVSRTPAVQAVKLLVNENVLRSGSNGRVEVPEYNDQDTDEICAVRLLFENYAIDQVMCDPEKQHKILHQLESCEEICINNLNKKKYLEFAKSDLLFHKTLVAGAGNKMLSDLFAKIQGRFMVMSYLILPLMNRDFSVTVREHDIFLDAMRAGDTDKMKQVIAEHIGKISEMIKHKG